MKISSSSCTRRIREDAEIQDQASASFTSCMLTSQQSRPSSSSPKVPVTEIEVKSTTTTAAAGNKRATPSSSSSSFSSPSSRSSGRSLDRNFPFYQIRCLLFYLFYVNWRKAPSITRILMINICLMASAGFFVLSCLLAYVSLILPTSVFLHLMVKCLLLPGQAAAASPSSS